MIFNLDDFFLQHVKYTVWRYFLDRSKKMDLNSDDSFSKTRKIFYMKLFYRHILSRYFNNNIGQKYWKTILKSLDISKTKLCHDF